MTVSPSVLFWEPRSLENILTLGHPQQLFVVLVLWAQSSVFMSREAANLQLIPTVTYSHNR